MGISFSVSLNKIIEKLNLKAAFMPDTESDILITNVDINRPGLQLAGFFNYFDNTRIQIFGRTETEYLEQMTREERNHAVETFFSKKPIAIIFTRSIEPDEKLMEYAKQYNIPILLTDAPTSNFATSLNAFLNLELAPRVTRHGVLVEVYGEGVLLIGDSGVGKSETAIELVKRGHRLIADDAVEIRRVSDKTLVGTSPENIRHFLELRGIGIINVRKIFGIGAVKVSEKIDMVINLEQWNQSKVYDRMGMDDETTDILGLTIPSLTIPIKPGRNLAIIIEVAAMNNRQKRLGYNAAHELLERLGMGDDLPKKTTAYDFDF